MSLIFFEVGQPHTGGLLVIFPEGFRSAYGAKEFLAVS